MIGAADGTVRIAHLDRELALIDRGAYGKSSDKGASRICWSPNGLEIAFIAEDRRSIAVIDALRKKQRIKIAAGNATILSIACGDKDLLAAACEDHSVRLWNRKTGTLLREIPMEQIPLRIAFRPGSQDLLIVGEQSRRSVI